MAYHTNVGINRDSTANTSLHMWGLKQRSLCFSCNTHAQTHTKKAAEPSRGNTEFSSQEPKSLVGRWEGEKGSGGGEMGNRQRKGKPWQKTVGCK